MQTNLFDKRKQDNINANSPLAVRMRPTTIDEFVGQENIIGEDKLLSRMIRADKLSSVIFFGPPGSGKTTLAKIIANQTSSNFYTLNAVTCGVKDIRAILDKAKHDLGMEGIKSMLFIDEIHRFNKSQQDALLPSVEEGIVTLIGATTENPFFEINSPLISRSTLFKLEAITKDNIKKIINNTLMNKEKGLGEFNIHMDEDAKEYISVISNGDARVALNALELSYLTTPKDKNGIIHIDIEVAQQSTQSKKMNYDKGDSEHHDTVSAFIKSMRGSDPDAAVYYLARMIYAGEDPKFIARRMVVFASEDIGNANINALNLAISTFKSVEIIGLPECRINLAQCAIYLASSPKSNASYLAINAALSDIQKEETYEIPYHIRNANYEGEKEIGIGVGYKYPHNFKNGYINQQYLPDEIKKRKYYKPKEIGNEIKIKNYLSNIRNKKSK